VYLFFKIANKFYFQESCNKRQEQMRLKSALRDHILKVILCRKCIVPFLTRQVGGEGRVGGAEMEAKKTGGEKVQSI